MAETSANKLSEIIQTSLENIRTMVDANTVIGNPINTESGTTIIPISKISMGFASGGLDYNNKNAAQGDGQAHARPVPQNFGGGGGTGLSISPIGFLVINKEGNVDLINVGSPVPNDPIDQISSLIERSPDIFAKLKAVFKKKADDPEDADDTPMA
ncbi:MAG: sporulation protein YtfJ [Clostridia bacterium]|nr:sporulation protein YtfJ [Clostridia bacterium]